MITSDGPKLPLSPVSGNGSSRGTASGSARWWKETDDDKLASAAVAAAQRIEASGQQKARERQWLLQARLYANAPVSSLYRMGVRQVSLGSKRADEAPSNRVNYNVVQSCIDTAAAKIAKNKTRALFLTSGGNYDQQQRAKKLTKYCDGWAAGVGLYELGQQVFTDCGWADAGIAHTYEDYDAGQVMCERVLPHEILVDDTDAMYGEPRSLFRRKYVPKDILVEQFARGEGEKAAALRVRIEGATAADPLTLNGAATDVVAVYEGWHLRSGKRATDGLHVIAIDGVLIRRETWDLDWFPFDKMVWGTRPVGWWGQAMAEQLIGIQIEIGRLLRTIQRCQHLCSVPRVLVEIGSEIVEQHLNNEVGAVVKYRGTKPELWVAAGVPQDLFMQLDALVKTAYELTGISQMAANAKKPEGLDAAVALREMHDIESERFVIIAQRFERFYLSIMEKMVAMSRRMYERNVKLRVRAPSTKLIEVIDWSDVDLKEDEYVLRDYPTSILPTMPSAKLQTVQELYGSQLLSDQSPSAVWARSLLDFPDLESYLSLEQAGLQDVQRLLANITERGEYDPPDEYISRDMAITLGHNALLKARSDGLPEQRIELLRRFIQEAMDLPQPQSATRTAPPGMPVGAGPIPPGGVPVTPGPQIPAVPSAVSAIPAP